MSPLPSKKSSAALRAALIALAWLVSISLLHLLLNRESQSSSKITMGYMPVIANLAAPVVDAASRGKGVTFEAVRFGSFAEMAEAFRSGHLQAAFIIAPLALALHQQGVPLKVVYIGNRHESTLVVGKDSRCETLLDLVGKTVAVPIRYSGHLLAIRRALREQGLSDQAVRLVEIPPPDMPAALATGGIDGYVVGEPFASKALHSGIGKRLLNVEALWPGFIGNLMIVREDTLRSHPDWIDTLVTACVRSGIWAQSHPEEAVRLLADTWGQEADIVRYALSHPPDRVRFDLYVPVVEEMEDVAQEMVRSGLLPTTPDVHGMVEDRFARAVDARWRGSLQEIVSR